MANQWVRLWTDMPNDPKWRSIARKSGQSIGNVIAVFVHMLTIAANAKERGCIEAWNDEDVASALDMDEVDIRAIREAMQGKVLDSNHLTGWEIRQPLREDLSTDRSRTHRERKQAQSNTEEHNSAQSDSSQRNATHGNADATQCNAPDTDTEADTENPPNPLGGDGVRNGSADDSETLNLTVPVVVADPEQPLRDLFAGFRQAYYPDKDAAFWQNVPEVQFDDRPTRALLRRLHKAKVTPEQLCRMTAAAIVRRGDRKYVTLRSVLAEWTENAESEKNPPSVADGPVKPVDDPALPISAKSRGTLSDCRFGGHPSRSEILAAGNRLPKWQGYEVATSGTGNQSRTNDPVPGWPCRDGHWYRPGPGGYDDCPIRCDERGNITAMAGRP